MEIELRAVRSVPRLLLLAAATSAVAREAAAVDCTTTVTSHCWQDLTTHNFAQVVVGQTDTSGNGSAPTRSFAIGVDTYCLSSTPPVLDWPPVALATNRVVYLDRARSMLSHRKSFSVAIVGSNATTSD